jgi:hypothetical protein
VKRYLTTTPKDVPFREKSVVFYAYFFEFEWSTDQERPQGLE